MVYQFYLLEMMNFHGKLLVITRWYSNSLDLGEGCLMIQLTSWKQ